MHRLFTAPAAHDMVNANRLITFETSKIIWSQRALTPGIYAHKSGGGKELHKHSAVLIF